MVNDPARNAKVETHQNQRQHLYPTRESAFSPQNIAQLVDRQRLGNGIRIRQTLGQVVEAKRDPDVFHDITFVQNIRSSRRDLDVECFLRILRRWSSQEGHACEVGADLGRREGKAECSVDVGYGCGGRSWCHVGRKTRCTVRVGDSHGFDSKGAE